MRRGISGVVAVGLVTVGIAAFAVQSFTNDLRRGEGLTRGSLIVAACLLVGTAFFAHLVYQAWVFREERSVAAEIQQHIAPLRRRVPLIVGDSQYIIFGSVWRRIARAPMLPKQDHQQQCYAFAFYGRFDVPRIVDGALTQDRMVGKLRYVLHTGNLLPWGWSRRPAALSDLQQLLDHLRQNEPSAGLQK